MAGAFMLTHGLQVLFGVVTASLGDRFNRRRVMLASEVAGAGAYLVVAQASGPTSLLIAVAVASLVTSPFQSASGASIPNLVGRDRLAWANSLMASGRHLGMTFGPAVGGLAVARWGPSVVFGLNGVSFLVSAAIILGVRGKFNQGLVHARVRGAGLSFLVRHPVIRLLTLAEVILVIGLGMMKVTQAPLADVLRLGPAGLGLMGGLWGGGLLAGALLGRRLTPDSEPTVFVVGLAGVAAAAIGVGLAPWVLAILALHFVIGLADSLDLIAGLGIRQRVTPDHLLSRVLATNSAVAVTTQIGGYALAGLLNANLSPASVYALSGVVVAMSVPVALPAVRLARLSRADDGTGSVDHAPVDPSAGGSGVNRAVSGVTCRTQPSGPIRSILGGEGR
ncbi:MAG: MFS transporter [Acidimicrobiales bacterium]